MDSWVMGRANSGTVSNPTRNVAGIPGVSKARLDRAWSSWGSGRGPCQWQKWSHMGFKVPEIQTILGVSDHKLLKQQTQPQPCRESSQPFCGFRDIGQLGLDSPKPELGHLNPSLGHTPSTPAPSCLFRDDPRIPGSLGLENPFQPIEPKLCLIPTLAPAQSTGTPWAPPGIGTPTSPWALPSNA